MFEKKISGRFFSASFFSQFEPFFFFGKFLPLYFWNFGKPTVKKIFGYICYFGFFCFFWQIHSFCTSGILENQLL